MFFIILELSLYKKGYIKKIKFVKMQLLINLFIKKTMDLFVERNNYRF
jgi:hypothetical protein